MLQPIEPPRGFHLSDVTVQYGDAAALRSVSMDIADGERVALVGPSGAGKTTLLRLLNGSVRAVSGEVSIHGQVVNTLSTRQLREVRSRIGFVHQDLRLVDNLRVIQNVLAGRLGEQSLLGAMRSMLLPSRAQTRRVYDLLQRVGIGEKLYQRTSHLSGGQQQRVAIARALHQEPIALLADEPVASVDPARARDTVRLLVEIAEQRGVTLCMSLHTLELAREFFPRLVGLRRGRIVFDRPSAQIQEAEFDQLYQLDANEILANGAGPSS